MLGCPDSQTALTALASVRIRILFNSSESCDTRENFFSLILRYTCCCTSTLPSDSSRQAAEFSYLSDNRVIFSIYRMGDKETSGICTHTIAEKSMIIPQKEMIIIKTDANLINNRNCNIRLNLRW